MNQETRVLVAYASKHGSTKGIADHIGEKLEQHGAQVDVLEVKQVRNLRDYDAFVIGSAVYMFHWLKEAKEFVMRNRAVLANRPVWLFSSGPLGKEVKDPRGRDYKDISEPKELDELKDAVKPRDHQVFFGALDRSKLGFAHRMILKWPVAGPTPEGDFRDWDDIEAWAISIAQAL